MIDPNRMELMHAQYNTYVRDGFRVNFGTFCDLVMLDFCEEEDCLVVPGIYTFSGHDEVVK